MVSLDEFQRISMCEIVKEAWDILKVTNEETKSIKITNVNLKVRGN